MLVGILNLNYGNIHNVKKILKILRVDFKSISKPKDFIDISHLIIPGVGSYKQCMKKIISHKIINVLKDTVKKKPVLAICLGMQILFEESSENGKTKGLGILKGKVVKLNELNSNIKCPNFGFYKLQIKKKFNFLKNKKFYFANSYYCKIKKNNSSQVLYLDDSLIKIPGFLKHKNILATQFHPELSRIDGIKIYKRFLDNKW